MDILCNIGVDTRPAPASASQQASPAVASPQPPSRPSRRGSPAHDSDRNGASPRPAKRHRSSAEVNLDQEPQGDSPVPEPEDDRFAGMTEQDIFRVATRPPEIDGVADWGIPAAVDPAESDLRLKVG